MVVRITVVVDMLGRLASGNRSVVHDTPTSASIRRANLESIRCASDPDSRLSTHADHTLLTQPRTHSVSEKRVGIQKAWPIKCGLLQVLDVGLQTHGSTSTRESSTRDVATFKSVGSSLARHLVRHPTMRHCRAALRARMACAKTCERTALLQPAAVACTFRKTCACDFYEYRSRRCHGGPPRRRDGRCHGGRP